MGSFVSNSVAQPVPGGSTNAGGGFFGRLIQQAVNSGLFQPVDNQTTQPAGITSLPITTQPVDQVSAPTTPVRGFNQVRDPRLNRIAIRPMFRTSRYDSQISNLLGKLLPDSAPSTPQMRPTTDPMGRSYNDPRYYKMGGRVNYQNGGRIGYADGTPAAGLVFNPEPYEGPYSGPYIVGGPRPGQYYSEPGSSLTSLNVPRSDLYKMTTANIMPGTGGFPGGPLQQESIKEALMSLPITRSNSLMNTLRKFNQVRDPRIARLLQQRQSRAMGGIMNLKMGGLPSEMDLRAKGGFVPIGKKERADDVPARLSKNEFVFTANAVRNAGGGDIRKGAKRMYNLMHQLEAKR